MGTDQIVDRDIKEALDLGCVQVHRQDAVGAGGGDEVCNELGGDGVTAFGLAVLTGIAEVRDHGGDSAGGSAAHRVDHDQQLHQAVVHGLAGGLDNKHVFAADGLIYGDGALAVRKCGNAAVAGVDEQRGTNVFGQSGIGISGKNRDLFPMRNHSLIILHLKSECGMRRPSSYLFTFLTTIT